jgi:hypothetical protein
MGAAYISFEIIQYEFSFSYHPTSFWTLAILSIYMPSKKKGT